MCFYDEPELGKAASLIYLKDKIKNHCSLRIVTLIALTI